MTELHVVPPPARARSGRRVARRRHLRTQLHRDLRWLQVQSEHAQLNAYWASPILPRRWLRFEVKRRGVVAGPLTLLIRVPKFPTPESERAHLVVVEREPTS
jgi:hypothetical protein